MKAIALFTAIFLVLVLAIRLTVEKPAKKSSRVDIMTLPFEELTLEQARFLQRTVSTTFIDCRRPIGRRHALPAPLVELSDNMEELTRTAANARNMVLIGTEHERAQIMQIAATLRQRGIDFPKILIRPTEDATPLFTQAGGF